MDALQEKMASISRERIGEEMRMMLEHPRRVAAMELLVGFPTMFREVFGFRVGGDAVDLDWPMLTGLPGRVDRAVALMAILRDAGVEDAKSAVAILRERLVLSNGETDELAWLCEKLPLLEKGEDLSKAVLKRIMAEPHWKALEMIYCADPANADQVFAFNERIEAMQEEGVAPVPFITGNMLIAMGASPGPTFKRWLDELYDRQLNGDLATKEDAVAAAKLLIMASS